jgi:hypothetical protein
VCVPGLYDRADAPAALASIRANVVDALGGEASVFAALFAEPAEVQRATKALIDAFGALLADVHISDKAGNCGSTELERQLIGRHTCYRAALASNHTYTSFIVAPAHLVWTQPLWPHCFQDLKAARIWRYVHWAPWSAAQEALEALAESFGKCVNSLDGAEWIEGRVIRAKRASLDASLAIAIAPRDDSACGALRAATPTLSKLPERHRLRPPPCPLIDDSRAVGAVLEPRTPFLCASQARPRLALLLGGLARTFPHELVFRSIKSHLIDAMGMDTVVFAHIRLQDLNTDPSAFVHAQRPNVERALDFLGALQENRVILNTAATPNNAHCHHFVERRPRGHENEPRHLDGAVQGQLWSRKALLDLMLAHEKRAQLRFDSVLFMRPDLTVMVPWLPFCLYDLSMSRITLDWLWWVSRADAEGALGGGYDDYFVQCVAFVAETYNASQLPDYSSPMMRGDPAAKFMLENWLKYRAFVHGSVLYQDPTMATAYLTRTDFKASACGWVRIFNNALGPATAPRRNTKMPSGSCHAIIDQNPFNKVLKE